MEKIKGVEVLTSEKVRQCGGDIVVALLAIAIVLIGGCFYGFTSGTFSNIIFAIIVCSLSLCELIITIGAAKAYFTKEMEYECLINTKELDGSFIEKYRIVGHQGQIWYIRELHENGDVE